MTKLDVVSLSDAERLLLRQTIKKGKGPARTTTSRPGGSPDRDHRMGRDTEPDGDAGQLAFHRGRCSHQAQAPVSIASVVKDH